MTHVCLPSLKILSWARAAILALRALLSTFRIIRWWSRNATRGVNIDTSLFNLSKHPKKTYSLVTNSQTNRGNETATFLGECWKSNPLTCSAVTLRSSSDMYWSFLTRDLCADCLFASILCFPMQTSKLIWVAPLYKACRFVYLFFVHWK